MVDFGQPADQYNVMVMPVQLQVYLCNLIQLLNLGLYVQLLFIDCKKCHGKSMSTVTNSKVFYFKYSLLYQDIKP